MERQAWRDDGSATVADELAIARHRPKPLEKLPRTFSVMNFETEPCEVQERLLILKYRLGNHPPSLSHGSGK